MRITHRCWHCWAYITPQVELWTCVALALLCIHYTAGRALDLSGTGTLCIHYTAGRALDLRGTGTVVHTLHCRSSTGLAFHNHCCAYITLQVEHWTCVALALLCIHYTAGRALDLRGTGTVVHTLHCRSTTGLACKDLRMLGTNNQRKLQPRQDSCNCTN